MPITITGEHVRAMRKQVGVSQADLARALGYTRANISKWERHPDRSIPRTQYERVLTYLAARKQTLNALLSNLQNS